MIFGRVFGVLVVLSLAATGAALAREISSGKAAAEKGTISSLSKGDKAGAKSGQGQVSVRHASKPQAPIVMGRSVSIHHKTKLHHVKMKPLDAADTPDSSGGPD